MLGTTKNFKISETYYIGFNLSLKHSSNTIHL